MMHSGRNHYLEGIPEPFLNELSDLYQSQIISDSSTEIFQVYSQYLTLIKEAKEIYWISPLISRDHIKALYSRIIEGTPVEMIIPSEIEMQFKKKPPLSELIRTNSAEYLQQYVSDDPIRFGMIMSNTQLLLGLFKSDMITFDASSHFVSSEPQALSWGSRLFLYYREKARRCSL